MAKYLLGLLAEDFSQTYNFVSWSKNLPFLLWNAAQGEEVEGAFGPVTLQPAERKLILELSTVADGWWVAHPHFENPNESFVSLKAWQERLADQGNA